LKKRPPFGPAEIAELKLALKEKRKPSMCLGCPRLDKTDNLYPDSFVWGRGVATATIEWLGRDPGIDEVAIGMSFCGGSGRVQAKLAFEAGLPFSTKYTPPESYITNVVKCNYSRKGSNNIAPLAKEIEFCSQYRDYENTYIRPNIRIVLGNEALKSELGGKVKISDWRGSLFESQRDGVKCLASFHPAFLMRGKQDFIWVVIQDLELAKKESLRPEMPLLKDSYVVNANPFDLSYQLESEVIVADLETTGLNVRKDKIRLVGVSPNDRNSKVYEWTPEISDLFANFISDSKKLFINHNINNFDLPLIENHTGVLARCQVHDTMVMSNLAHSDLSNSLAFNSSLYTDRPFWKHLSEVNEQWYCAEDVANTSDVYKGLKVELKEQGTWDYFLNRSCKLAEVTREMNRLGINLDHPLMHAKRLEIIHAEFGLVERLRAEIGDPEFNFKSPKQMMDLLYNKLKLPKQYHEKTKKLTSDETALNFLSKIVEDNPIFDLALELRGGAKLASTYLSISDERCYPDLASHKTATGRYSAPLILLVPEGVARQIYIPDNKDMEFYYADWKQIEFIIYSIITGQTDMLEAAEAGHDVHEWTGSELDLSRGEGKTLNYGLIFGQGYRSLAKKHGGGEKKMEGFHS